MNSLLDVAERLLQVHREFHPLGGYLLDDGTVVQLGLKIPHSDFVAGKERAMQVEEALREIAASVMPLAVGLVTNVTLSGDDGGRYDAIEIDLEHRGGYCAEVFFGYYLSDTAPEVEWTITTAQAGKSGRFFGA